MKFIKFFALLLLPLIGSSMSAKVWHFKNITPYPVTVRIPNSTHRYKVLEKKINPGEVGHWHIGDMGDYRVKAIVLIRPAVHPDNDNNVLVLNNYLEGYTYKHLYFVIYESNKKNCPLAFYAGDEKSGHFQYPDPSTIATANDRAQAGFNPQYIHAGRSPRHAGGSSHGGYNPAGYG